MLKFKIFRSPRVQLSAPYAVRVQDLLPVNDISHAREKPISQKIRENVTLLHAHLGESRAVNRARGARRRQVNHLLLVAVLGDVRKHEEW